MHILTLAVLVEIVPVAAVFGKNMKAPPLIQSQRVGIIHCNGNRHTLEAAPLQQCIRDIQQP